ncbi:MAG: hypothetical protein FD180_34 [Planctomycetota bacterium]|nr:MAG: hypothetical protein FD180_34 [Planctomycetota bacterium]
MRRFALAIAAFSLSLCADDKPDLRQESADKIAAKVAKMEFDGAEPEKFSDKIQAMSDEFSAANAPAGEALAIASSDGKVILVVGGKGAKDGLTVAVATPPKGRKVLLRGGDGGTGGRAGRSALWIESGAGTTWCHSPQNGARGEREDAFYVTVTQPGAGYWVSGSTGANGTDAEEGGQDDLVPKDDVKAVADAVEKVNAAWENEAKRKTEIEELSKHRPTRGVIAAFSTDGKLLVLIGASGNDRNPDGASVELAGKVAERMVAIAGSAGKGGKPGVAIAPQGAVTIDEVERREE